MSTNKYLSTVTRPVPGIISPGNIFAIIGTYEKTAADTDGSILRLGKIPSGAIPIYNKSNLFNDAIAGLTAVDVGIYKTLANGGAVVDANLFSAALDPHAGNARTAPAKLMQTHPLIEEDGLTVLALTNLVNTTTLVDEEFDVALTLTTGGANTGTISYELFFMIPQSG